MRALVHIVAVNPLSRLATMTRSGSMRVIQAPAFATLTFCTDSFLAASLTAAQLITLGDINLRITPVETSHRSCKGIETKMSGACPPKSTSGKRSHTMTPNQLLRWDLVGLRLIILMTWVL